MRIGLIDVDGHNFPNFALMKIASYHKQNNDKVEWATINPYDIIYMSKVFTFTKDHQQGIITSSRIIKGGTGYDVSVHLPEEIETQQPDYTLYPQYTHAYGFLTRGCPNKCSYCIVPRKEGLISPYADIEDILQGRHSAILMDNNVLAHSHGLQQIEKIIRLGIKVDFNQGLDARIIAKDKGIAEMLTKVKWINHLRIACDTKAIIPFVDKAIDNLNEYGFRSKKIFVYVLTKEIPDALERIMFLREKGCTPFAQPFRDFVKNTPPTAEAKQFARWVNRKEIFYSVSYEDYIKRRITI